MFFAIKVTFGAALVLNEGTMAEEADDNGAVRPSRADSFASFALSGVHNKDEISVGTAQPEAEGLAKTGAVEPGDGWVQEDRDKVPWKPSID